MSEAQIAEQVSPLAFIMQNEIKNENGEVMEFGDHYFLIDPYTDLTPEQVVMKASQVGWSVLAVNKSLWLAKYKRANVIYTLPSKSVVKDFVQPKVDPIIAQNNIYQEWVTNDSITLKEVSDRFVFFRGSWEEGAAISITAEVLINDEVDRSNPKVLRTYKTRLDDAKRKRPDLGFVWQFSNPSVPSAGVHEVWERSDQKHWYIKCPHCKEEHFMEWPISVNMELEKYICKLCGGILQDQDRRVGRWIAHKPDSKISGYWINQMMCTWHSAEKIINDSRGDKQTFYNFTLGLPYINEDQKVDRSTIVKCISLDTNNKQNVAMGVDVGNVKTVVLGNSYGIFKTYETESWETIEEDIKLYRAKVVIDAMPYPNTPRKLSERYKGKVWLHWFKEDVKNVGIVEWGQGDKSNVVYSDRTKIIDSLVAEFQNQDITFNLTVQELEQYINDWTVLYREIEEDARGRLKPVWKTIASRRDHFAFATIYWRIALEKTFSGGGVIRTPSKKNKAPEHPVISPDKTVPAVDVKDVLHRAQRGKRDWRTK